jgi:N6-L-threonylcarbamoyladenine synthase
VSAALIATQIDIHRQFGGVVPEVAARAHLEAVLPLVETALKQAQISGADLDAIAVTNRPGLIGALLIGVTVAKALALVWDKPLIGVNHLEGHIAAATFSHPVEYPFVALIVSGGHTNIYYCPAVGAYEKIGATLDDAAGEAFDKAAKILELGFPGGPAIARAAEQGDADFYPWSDSCLPRKNPSDFSFSGLKTAVLYAARGQAAGRKGELLLDAPGVANAAASFQRAVVRALVKRTIKAAKERRVKWIALGGGVAANKVLRAELAAAAQKIHCATAIPPFDLCADNAVMIAARALEMFAAGQFADLNLDAAAR